MIGPRLVATAATALLGAVLGLGIGYWHYSPRLAAAKGDVAVLADKLKQQNAAIEKLAAVAAEREAAVAAAIAQARDARQESDRLAAEILAREPPPGVDECLAASDFIRQELNR